jgi:hypothetical protein
MHPQHRTLIRTFSRFQRVFIPREPPSERILSSFLILAWVATLGSIGICIFLIVRAVPTINLPPHTPPHLYLAR